MKSIISTALSFLVITKTGSLASRQQIPIVSESLAPAPLTLDALPLLGFGTWNLDRSNASDAVALAIEAGYRHIDCAAIYGNEVEVGRGIKWGLEKAQLKRSDIWVTSKLWNDGHGDNGTVSGALNKTLADLGVGYLDLYHMHWPVTETKEGSHEIEYLETWESMVTLLSTGWVRHIGVSNFSPAQLKDLLDHGSVRPAVHQMEMHPYLQQSQFLAMHRKLGIHVTAYSPLAGTNPTYKPGEPPALLSENKHVREIAEKRGCTTAQVVLYWGLARQTSVIPKSQRADHILENLATPKCHLKTEDLKQLDRLGEFHHRYNNPSNGWGVQLYEGLEDSDGRHKAYA
ncbi:Aldo/keto reductase [Polychaeton citri CBS 116435]|uniref:Aldo/keto reductase n=1 Tax=Polychaeton citri CBS 116435 TaxID=1314669 RepID=A0A9P4Q4X9_9PEZI|nr:Aldo/keto reductase [Polychaeton citri CBS 116435]